MIYKLLALGAILISHSQTIGQSKSTMEHTGKFIMMPDNQEASFLLDLDHEQITINQNNQSVIIPLQQAIQYEDYYSAPNGKQLIKEESKVIHISKNVFNDNDSIEVLIQLAYELANNNPNKFVIDLLVSENGSVKLIGSTNWAGTSMGSHPVFAIIDDKAYYGIYDDRHHGLIDESVGSFLKDYQRLNAIPYIMESGFANGTISFRKTNWKYAQEKGIPIEKLIQDKRNYITQLMGDKEQSITVNHTIQYYGRDYKPANKVDIQVKMVATYNNADYNPKAIRYLMLDLGKCPSTKIIPILMEYLEDDRSLNLPGDDYLNTTISMLAQRTFSEILRFNPELLINYKENSTYKDPLTKWWKENKQLYE